MQAQAKSQIRLGERMTQKPPITLMHPLTKKTNKVGSENNTKATYNNEAAPNKEPDKVGSENKKKPILTPMQPQTKSHIRSGHKLTKKTTNNTNAPSNK